MTEIAIALILSLCLMALTFFLATMLPLNEHYIDLLSVATGLFLMAAAFITIVMIIEQVFT